MPPALTDWPCVDRRLFMTADAVGGVWTYALDLARGLRARGIATTLAVAGPSPSPHAAAAARRIPDLELIDTELALDWLAEDEATVATAAAAMARLSRQAGADIVQLNSPALAAFGDFTKPSVGVCHSCTSTWWRAVRGGEPDSALWWRTRLLTRGYRACDVLVAPSHDFALATQHGHGVLPVVVHNGRTVPPPRHRLRERFVLTAGRLWDDGKNLVTLDAAAALVDAPVFAAGPLAGPVAGTMRLHRVQPLGRLDDDALQDLMQRAAIFVSMAVYEPFGLAVLEAAQAGCALVLSDIAVFRELWDGAATFVAADQPAALAATLQHLLDDPDLAAAQGKLAQRHAGRYGVAAMADAMVAHYQTAIDCRIPVVA